MDKDEEIQQRLMQERFQSIVVNVDSQYSCLATYHLNCEQPIVLTDDDVPKKCRFCGLSEPTVTFKKKAHALSHMVENRHLKSEYECDSCNQRFAIFESDFSQYMNLYHTLFGVHGKGGIPKYRIGSKDISKIESDGFTVRIDAKVDEEPLIEWTERDKENKTVKIIGKRTYTPINVLKALVKMVLSVMPKSELPQLDNTINWLMERQCDDRGVIFPALFRLYREGMPFTSCMVYKKLDGVTGRMPTYIFRLAYNHIVIQLPIPYVETDFQLKGKCAVNMPACHTILDIYQKPFLVTLRDLSSPDKVYGEPLKIDLSYCEAIKKDSIADSESVNHNAPTTTL